jgi:uncharacterized membrane protein
LDLYELLKFFHVLFAATWLGTAVQQQFASARARASNDQAVLARFADDAEWLGKKLFAPAAGLTALFGVLLVLQSGWDFKDLWVAIGIVLFLVAVFTGARFLTPESGRLRDLISAKGLDDQEVRARISRILMVTRIDLLLLVLVVADMVIKPGT